MTLIDGPARDPATEPDGWSTARLELAAKGERSTEDEEATVAKLDRVRKKQSPRRTK